MNLILLYRMAKSLIDRILRLTFNLLYGPKSKPIH